MTWTTLSRRGSGPDGPFEGAPAHLRSSLIYWLEGMAGYRDPRGMHDEALRRIAMLLRHSVPRHLRGSDLLTALIDAADEDEDFLDLIDASLHVWASGKPGAEVDELLAEAGSVWCVGLDGASLARRVSGEAQAAVDAVVAAGESASDELAEAWTRAFGRSADPSDAWDHAIKAVESMICPLVEPARTKPTLGTTLRVLSDVVTAWQGPLPGPNNDFPVEPVLELLRAIWPNPDRHGAGARRPPTQPEAQSAVMAAVTIAQWDQISYVVKKR